MGHYAPQTRDIPPLDQKYRDSFWDKTRINFETGCIEWTACTDRKGYGKFAVGYRYNHKTAFLTASRIAWTMRYGAIPQGQCVLHKCDNPPCVNVEHLFLGSMEDNLEDMRRKGRDSRGPSHAIPVLTRGWTRGEKNGNAVLSEEVARDILLRIHAGETRKDVARIHGISQTTVGDIVLGRAWMHVERPAWLDLRVRHRQGAAASRAKLSRDQAMEIRQRARRRDEPVASIAREFAVSPSLVRAIRDGLAWRGALDG